MAKLLGVNQWTLIGWETGRQVRVFARHEAAITHFLGYSPFPPPRTLGEAIRRKRRELGLTFRELATRLGWDEGTVRRYEHGIWAPRGDRRERVERFLARSSDHAQTPTLTLSRQGMISNARR